MTAHGAATLLRQSLVSCRVDMQVETELSVRREQLVELALLLGSDYTDGVNGVGIVNAMEVISSFTADAGGLQAFRRWVRSWRNDADTGADAGEGEGGGEREGEGGASPRLKAFKNRHKKVRRNWTMPDDFPSKQVVEV